MLEVSQIGKECHSGCAIKQQVGDCIMPRRGIFGKVVQAGEVQAGMEGVESRDQIADRRAQLQQRVQSQADERGLAQLHALGQACEAAHGQTSDVISPLVPKTVNYTVGWAQGNIGYRRPQFRLTTWTDVGSGKLTACVAAARTIGHDLDQRWLDGTPDSLLGTGDGIDDGADSPMPTIQGRLGLETGFGSEGNVAIGVSGHYGREEAKITTFSTGGGLIDEETLELESWSFNVDLKLKLTSRASVSGEFFIGQNLGAYLGGVLQDYGPDLGELGAMGGWGMLSLVPAEKATFNIGYCFDDPDENDFIVAEGGSGSMINMNSVFFGNVMYSVTKNVTAMIEGSYLKTTYLTKTMSGGISDSNDLDFDSIRIQAALKAAIM